MALIKILNEHGDGSYFHLSEQWQEDQFWSEVIKHSEPIVVGSQPELDYLESLKLVLGLDFNCRLLNEGEIAHSIYRSFLVIDLNQGNT